MKEFETHKVLIWGKTTPELSMNHVETVCTGGVLESGEFVRLYPIPFRLLEAERQFPKYAWISVSMRRSKSDQRLESRVIQPDSITLLNGPYDTSVTGLQLREKYIMKDPKYQLGSVEELIDRQKVSKQSIGLVSVRNVRDVRVRDRSSIDMQNTQDKLAEIKEQRMQGNLFTATGDETWYTNPLLHEQTLAVEWTCWGPDCQGHNMGVLDWEAAALKLRIGPKGAAKRLAEILERRKKHLRFFLGNIKAHPTSFVIGGFWYWPVTAQQALDFH